MKNSTRKKPRWHSLLSYISAFFFLPLVGFTWYDSFEYSYELWQNSGTTLFIVLLAATAYGIGWSVGKGELES